MLRDAQRLTIIALILSNLGGSLCAVEFGRTMTTVQYDNARSGWNRDENILTLKTVNSEQFGKIWTAQLVGQIYAAPLYVSGADMGGQTRDVVYAATEANVIFAVDANTGSLLWMNDSLGTPGSRSLLLCGNISPDIGITSTPVIDLETKTLYAVGLTRQGTIQQFKMVALDIETGESRPGWPIVIDPPETDAPFNPRVSSQRGALLLANGLIYVGFGGYAGDCGSYYGWVVGVDKNDPNKPQIVFRVPSQPSEPGAGIWSSAGFSADEAGNIYPVTGNSFQAPDLLLTNAVLRLGPDLSFSGQTQDYFMPTDFEELNRIDADLGSVAALVLPPQPASNTPNMMFVAGKVASGDLLNRDNLGGIGGEIFSASLFNRNYNTAVYYEDPQFGPLIFVAGRGQGQQPGCENTVNGVVALQLDVDANGNSYYYARWCSASMGNPPIDPLVTSTAGQTGILWILDRQTAPTRIVLHALNAATGDELYNSDVIKGDELGAPPSNLIHFTVIDGKAFVGDGAGKLVAYGLRR